MTAAGAMLWGMPCRATAPAVNPHAAPEHALMLGRVDEAVAALQSMVSQNPKDAEAHLLLCRAFYSEEMADEAVNECEAAVQGLSGNSDAQDWMGRAYGRKADSSGPIGGYKLARKVQAAFEQAVNLNPGNSAATDDLSEYFIGAPSILGGGVEKAESLADRVQTLVPQSAHRIRGLVAEERKDYGTAEREFRAAVGVAGRPDAWADLGHYYARRKQDDQSQDALAHCLAADPALDASVVDAASILMEIHRATDVAERVLRDYLSRGSQSDAAPTFKVHVILGRLLEKKGDKAGAKIEYNQALELARDYAPAKKALQGL